MTEVTNRQFMKKKNLLQYCPTLNCFESEENPFVKRAVQMCEGIVAAVINLTVNILQWEGKDHQQVGLFHEKNKRNNLIKCHKKH